MQRAKARQMQSKCETKCMIMKSECDGQMHYKCKASAEGQMHDKCESQMQSKCTTHAANA